MFNRALLRKWLWRYVHEREAWWRVVVDSKFGSSWGGWCSIDSLGPYGVGLWKNMWRFSNHTRFELGDGSKIKFCEDAWCGEMALKEAFSELYSIACVKEASVAVHLDPSSGSFQWNVSFIRVAL